MTGSASPASAAASSRLGKQTAAPCGPAQERPRFDPGQEGRGRRVDGDGQVAGTSLLEQPERHLEQRGLEEGVAGQVQDRRAVEQAGREVGSSQPQVRAAVGEHGPLAVRRHHDHDRAGARLVVFGQVGVDTEAGQFPPVVIGVPRADPSREGDLSAEMSHPRGLAGRGTARAGPDGRRGVAARGYLARRLDQDVIDHVAADDDPAASRQGAQRRVRPRPGRSAPRGRRCPARWSG